MGRGRVGCVVVQKDVVCLSVRGSGKKMVSSGLRRQVACMVGSRIGWIMAVSRNAARSFSLAMRKNSIGHLAGVSSMDESSARVWAGTKRMCPVGMRIRVDMLVRYVIAFEVHGVSSHTGSIMTKKNGVFVHSNEASVWKIALSMSSGSYSGLAMHEAVHRYKNKLRKAPKLTSSGKADPSVMLYPRLWSS